MGRPRSYDEATVIAAAREVFSRHGYAATSVDDLVQALNLHRGSLYKAFGSKRGLFVAVLTDEISNRLPAALARTQDLVTTDALDLVLVAAADLGPHDPEIAALVGDACHLIAGNAEAFAVLGARLIARMDTPPEPPHKRAVPST